MNRVHWFQAGDQSSLFLIRFVFTSLPCVYVDPPLASLLRIYISLHNILTKLIMGPSISVRKYIRWFPDTESEPTDTVVVTSVENRFVDIRILKPTKPDNESHQREIIWHLDIWLL